MPRNKRVVPSAKKSEEKLRKQLRKAFLSIDKQGKLASSRIVEDQLIKLIKDYAAAPKNERDAIYLKGEKRILQTVRKLRANKLEHPRA